MTRLLACLLIALAATTASAEPVRALRGLASHVDIEYPARLRARSDQSPTSPVMVRISQAPGGSTQRIEFIGAIAGNYDLRDYVERDDGRPLGGLVAMPVRVVTQLPPDPGTDLYSSAASWFNWGAHYRAVMWTAVALWAALPLAFLLVRRMRRPPEAAPVSPLAPPPSLEEQLITAIQVAAASDLSTADRARLELLVFRYLGGQIGSDAAWGDHVSAVQAVRDHPDTRDLVASLERWLHARPAGTVARDEAANALREFSRTRLAPRVQSLQPVEGAP